MRTRPPRSLARFTPPRDLAPETEKAISQRLADAVGRAFRDGATRSQIRDLRSAIAASQRGDRATTSVVRMVAAIYAAEGVTVTVTETQA